MPDRYTLPAEDGGAEVELYDRPPYTVAGADFHWYQLLGSGRLILASADMLTPVKPPLPPEPTGVGTAVRGPKRTFVRDEPDSHYDDHWYPGGGDTGWTWSDVCAEGEPVLLVPDPFAYPVGLPANVTGEFAGTGARVALDGEGRPLLQVEISGRMVGVVLAPDSMRYLVRAGWAAANQADKGDHE